jgi:hypothetical protein
MRVAGEIVASAVDLSLLFEELAGQKSANATASARTAIVPDLTDMASLPARTDINIRQHQA